ncbi:platelet-derived growth factor receptor-like protein isoform X2 [Gambusia affinis]|uniref:platelet-derived growth factor receptor-like protein isoform X2 n=1 Tax=Gambusia affinis TaxID=33528 RepID=UPI001CDD5CA4|nr:platelet-derived growth factor receptor-like protein isoform X2 [Gambusia affinis]
MMSLLKLSESKWRLVLSALLVCAVVFESDAKEEKTTRGRTSTPKKATNKRQRAESVKPKTKPTAAAQTKASLTQVLGRGVFKKVGETLSVQTGDTLSLRCRGKPVQWSVPLYVEEDEGRLVIVQQERFSLLTLVNTTVADTGEYTCYPMYCEDKDCRREYNKAIKVFIFFPDPRELFTPSSSHYEMIQLRSNWPTVLPCQVTSPEAKVTLHREFPPGEVSVDGTEISFNNRKGFTIHRPQLHHAGVLHCVATLGNLRQSSTKPHGSSYSSDPGIIKLGGCGGQPACGLQCRWRTRRFHRVQLGIPRTADREASVHRGDGDPGQRRSISAAVSVRSPGG